MTTNQLGIRNSNIIVPYTAATKRSKQVDITFTGSNLATILMAKAIFYADSAGAWRMRFNIAYTATATAVSETITLTNISTAGLAASQVFSATNSTAAQSVLYSAVNAASPAVMLVVFSATTSSTREFSGDIALAAEPTTYTTAANMEGVLPVDVYIPPVSSGVAGIFPALNTELDNVTATRLGLKQYLADVSGGTNDIGYSGGAKATIALIAGGGSISAIPRATLRPYQCQDGSWRLHGVIMVTMSSVSRSELQISVNGILSKNVSNDYQSYNTANFAVPCVGYIDPNTNVFRNLHSTTTTTLYSYNFDVELNAKPTWAY